MPTSSTIALLTDFGLHDHYVGTMKGAMLSANTALSIIDITHEVAPHNIKQASYFLWASYKFFPPKTIFVCVVDPGVGTERTIIAVRTKDHIFLAPNNGLLDLVCSEEQFSRAIEINVRRGLARSLTRPHISSTFQGRDIFAPLAAHIAKGLPVNRLGKTIRLERSLERFVSPNSPDVAPEILHIDRFGNIITNVKGDDLIFVREKVKSLRVKGKKITRWIQNYQSAPVTEPCLIVGSNGLVEIVVKNGSAAQMLSADTNTLIKMN